jgi:hypothetical protein
VPPRNKIQYADQGAGGVAFGGAPNPENHFIRPNAEGVSRNRL